MLETLIKRQVCDLVLQYKSESMSPIHMQWCVLEYLRRLVNFGYLIGPPNPKVTVQNGLISIDLDNIATLLVTPEPSYDELTETDTWLVSIKTPITGCVSGWVMHKTSTKSSFWYRQPNEPVVYTNPLDLDRVLKGKITRALNALQTP